MEVCYAIVKVQLSIRTLFGKSLYISRLFMYNNVGKVVTFLLAGKNNPSGFAFRRDQP